MSEKKEKDKYPKPTFGATLEMTKIHNRGCRFRVVWDDPKMANTVDIHHVIIDRKFFPKDDDFNMDFITLPKMVDEDDQVEAIEAAKKKQKAFKKFMKFRLEIA